MSLRFGVYIEKLEDVIIKERSYAKMMQQLATPPSRAVNKDGFTYEQIGALIDLTRERVRQIEEESLKRLRLESNIS